MATTVNITIDGESDGKVNLDELLLKIAENSNVKEMLEDKIKDVMDKINGNKISKTIMDKLEDLISFTKADKTKLQKNITDTLTGKLEKSFKDLKLDVSVLSKMKLDIAPEFKAFLTKLDLKADKPSKMDRYSELSLSEDSINKLFKKFIPFNEGTWTTKFRDIINKTPENWESLFNLLRLVNGSLVMLPKKLSEWEREGWKGPTSEESRAESDIKKDREKSEDLKKTKSMEGDTEKKEINLSKESVQAISIGLGGHLGNLFKDLKGTLKGLSWQAVKEEAGWLAKIGGLIGIAMFAWMNKEKIMKWWDEHGKPLWDEKILPALISIADFAINKIILPAWDWISNKWNNSQMKKDWTEWWDTFKTNLVPNIVKGIGSLFGIGVDSGTGATIQYTKLAADVLLYPILKRIPIVGSIISIAQGFNHLAAALGSSGADANAESIAAMYSFVSALAGIVPGVGPFLSLLVDTGAAATQAAIATGAVDANDLMDGLLSTFKKIPVIGTIVYLSEAAEHLANQEYMEAFKSFGKAGINLTGLQWLWFQGGDMEKGKMWDIMGGEQMFADEKGEKEEKDRAAKLKEIRDKRGKEIITGEREQELWKEFEAAHQTDITDSRERTKAWWKEKAAKYYVEEQEKPQRKSNPINVSQPQPMPALKAIEEVKTNATIMPSIAETNEQIVKKAEESNKIATDQKTLTMEQTKKLQDLLDVTQAMNDNVKTLQTIMAATGQRAQENTGSSGALGEFSTPNDKMREIMRGSR